MAAKTVEIDQTVREAYGKVIEANVPDAEYTAYGIHTVLNKVLALGGAAPVRPQMMYNYARNGLVVPGEKIAGTALRTFTRDEVTEFILRYTVRNGIKITEVNPDQLELDLQFDTDETTVEN
jgi:hypothetical protein